jgi:hypothetical protein
MCVMRKTLLVFSAMIMIASAAGSNEVLAAERSVHRKVARHGLPAGLPRAHYNYRTTIVSGPPVPYNARPYAYGRYGYAPYTNSYGIPAAVIIDPVDPAYTWRQPYPYYAPVYGVYATPYSCFYYGNC